MQTFPSTPQPGYTTFAEINSQALRENVQLLQKQAGPIKIMAVVKADAYGHGVALISNILRAAGITRFMVATLDEGLQLRALLPHAQILVASPPHPENLQIYCNQRLDVSITSEAVAQSVLKSVSPGCQLKVHAKIDTGMNRLGISLHRATHTIEALLDSADIEVAGIWSHLATAGDEDKAFAAHQINQAYRIVDQLPSFDGYFHVGNSGTLLNHRESIGRRKKEIIRLGGALLGIPASARLGRAFGLQPVMSLKSTVIHIRDLLPGESVSYGRAWTSEKATRIAVVGAGYADGYPSALSGKAHVYIENRPYPIVGRICMDMFMVDIGRDNTTVQPGDEVVLFDQKQLDIYDIARISGLIHYEICCRIPMRVPRQVV